MSYTAKSVIFDIADNHGGGSISIRAIDFWFEGTKINLVLTTDYVAYVTSKVSTFYDGWRTFYTALSKTGNQYNTQWVSNSVSTNQRLIIVFNSSTEFDEIRVNNGHSFGGSTNEGANNVAINISTDTITSTVYDEAISNSTLIYDSTFDEHVASDVEDEQILSLLGAAVLTKIKTGAFPNFHRKLWKQKPQAWGPFSAVQSELFRNAERMGINPSTLELAWPLWTPGTQYDYSKNALRGAATNVIFREDGAYFNGITADITVTDTGNFLASGTERYTLISDAKTAGIDDGFTFAINYSDPSWFINKTDETLDFYDGGDKTGSTLAVTADVLTNIAFRRKSYLSGDFGYFINGVAAGTGLHSNTFPTITKFQLGYSGGGGFYSEHLTTYLLYFSDALADSQISLIHDNPYALWQRQATVVYSIPKNLLATPTNLTGTPDTNSIAWAWTQGVA